MRIEQAFENKKISKRYLKLSLQDSTQLEESQRQLLVLDLNGTLCSRTTTKSYFARPHSKTFFDYIFKEFTVMVWSSAQNFSVEKMCKMFEPYEPFAIWDRSHLGLSEIDFHSHVDTVKDLKRVWKEFKEFNAMNTIVLDDTSSKLGLQQYNLVKMSTFNFPLVKGERDLLKVIKYLKELKYQSNVCSYIRKSPLDIEIDHGIKEDKVKDMVLMNFVNGKVQVPKKEKVEKKEKKKKWSAEKKREVALSKASEVGVIRPSTKKNRKKRKAKAAALRKEIALEK